jgi:hypothetical protein
LQGGEKVHLEIEVPAGSPFESIALQLRVIPAVENVALLSEQDGRKSLSIETTGSDIRKDLFRLSVEKGWTLLELHREQTSLEDIFRQLTSDHTK